MAVGWYSDDANKTTVFKVALSSDGGQSFSDPLTVSPGRSDAAHQSMSDYAREFQYGDYTRIDFVDGIVQPIWADNSSKLPNLKPVAFDTASARVGIAQVSGIPPIVQANTLTVTEGSEFTEVVATFTDPDPDGEGPNDYSALIDWGDGNKEMGTIELDGSGYRVMGTHEYAKKRTSETTVSITNLTSPHSPPTLAQGTANVADATLTPINHSIRVIEDMEFTDTIAFFTDENSHSVREDFTATISWGDNTANSVGAIEFIETADGTNLYGILGSHTYVNEQTYSATITITETGGANIVASSQITSGDPPISVVPQGQGSVEIKTLEGVFYTGPANGPSEESLPFMQGPLDDDGACSVRSLGIHRHVRGCLHCGDRLGRRDLYLSRGSQP